MDSQSLRAPAVPASRKRSISTEAAGPAGREPKKSRAGAVASASSVPGRPAKEALDENDATSTQQLRTALHRPSALPMTPGDVNANAELAPKFESRSLKEASKSRSPKEGSGKETKGVAVAEGQEGYEASFSGKSSAPPRAGPGPAKDVRKGRTIEKDDEDSDGVDNNKDDDHVMTFVDPGIETTNAKYEASSYKEKSSATRGQKSSVKPAVAKTGLKPKKGNGAKKTAKKAAPRGTKAPRSGLDDETRTEDAATDAELRELENGGRDRHIGWRREGRRDHVVLRGSEYVPREDAEAAVSERDRLEWAQEVASVLNRHPATGSSPDGNDDVLPETAMAVKAHVEAIFASATTHSTTASNAAAGPPSSHPGQDAQSPHAGEMLASVFEAVKTHGLKEAIATFLVTVSAKASRANEQGTAEDEQRTAADTGDDVISDLMKLAEDKVEQVCRAHGVSEEDITRIKTKLISPEGPIDAPIGRLSNYPPANASSGEHKQGVNTTTWTGERLQEKHGDINGFFWDCQIMTAPVGQTEHVVPLSRGMPDRDLDGLAAGLGPILHRLLWDLSLLVLRARLLLLTLTLATGRQAVTTVENVVNYLTVHSDCTLEVVKAELTVPSVTNEFGTYAERIIEVDWYILFRMQDSKPVVQSIAVAVPQWCVARASSDYCNSSAAYAQGCAADCGEDLLGLLETGKENTTPSHSNLARAGLPRDLSIGYHPTTMATLLLRARLRGDEMRNDFAVPFGDIPDSVINMSKRTGDLDFDVAPDTTSINGKTPLHYFMSCSALRGFDTARQEMFELEDGRAVNGMQMRGLKARATQLSTVVEVNGEVMTQAEATGKAISAAVNKLIVVNGEEMTIADERGLRSGSTNWTRCAEAVKSCLSDFITVQVRSDGSTETTFDWPAVPQYLVNKGLLSAENSTKERFFDLRGLNRVRQTLGELLGLEGLWDRGKVLEALSLSLASPAPTASTSTNVSADVVVKAQVDVPACAAELRDRIDTFATKVTEDGVEKRQVDWDAFRADLIKNGKLNVRFAKATPFASARREIIKFLSRHFGQDWHVKGTGARVPWAECANIIVAHLATFTSSSGPSQSLIWTSIFDHLVNVEKILPAKYISGNADARYRAKLDCGQMVQIKRVDTGQTIQALVADSCPTCNNNSCLDLSWGAFQALGGTQSMGVFDITWVRPGIRIVNIGTA
ncbi:hypothetical protein JCM10908_002433 [Rhodotorula pacifica]|uniref:uncharacterized protein n=1 Tax=Rhodotorula pacifica TaxID=1495444 RepID=UPI00317C8BB6